MKKTILELNQEIITCRRCPRLVEWCEKVAREKRRAFRNREYWGKPVPGFGDIQARIFVVGLAPGAHGSNRTGRQFTGDASGDFLYRALYNAGFASQPISVSRDDGLVLHDLYTAPVCRCAPPENKPTRIEMDNCQEYLIQEIILIHPIIFIALGKIAFDRIKKVLLLDDARIVFHHGAVYPIQNGMYLIGSYHPSRQNTQTGRLTMDMFEQIWKLAHDLLNGNTI
jgi:uracil-DNA glycosylase